MRYGCFCSRTRDRAPALLIRSPARNQYDPDFFLSPDQTSATRHVYEQHRPSCDVRETQRDLTFFPPNEGGPVQRGEHFWVRSRVELTLEALACHPRTAQERIRAPWNVVFFFVFFFCFSFLPCFLSLLKSSFRTSITHARTTKHLKTPS